MSDDTHSKNFERCSNCNAELAPATERCPNCGAPVPQKRPEVSGLGRLLSWRYLRHFLIAAILLLLPYVPHGLHWLRLKLPLRTSPLVFEAVNRANDHLEAVEMLGQPITAGWFVKGYIRGDETGWSEGQVWIPVSGTKGEGTLYARAGQAYGPWVFSELRLTQDNGRIVDLLAQPTPSSLAPLQTQSRVFIVPIGGVQGLGLHELPEFYHRKLGLQVQLLAPVPLEARARNLARRQLVFEELVALMRRHQPILAKDESALLIGVTDEDMYIRDPNWNFAYTAYDHQAHVGAVSSARFTPFLYRLRGKEALLQTRVRKMITRTIGVMIYNLPRNDDPTSVMYRNLYGAASADLMSESFEGLGSRAVVDEFKTGHGLAPQTPELLPGVSQFDEATVDGRYPCLQVRKRRDTGATFPTLDVTINKCLQRSLLDTEVNEIEVDLRTGLLVTRTTDLFVPGAIPIAATRCYRLWENRPQTFGQNTTLSWDMYPVGSRQPYTRIDVILCDGNYFHYDRISKGTGYADALYEHRQTATPFLRSRFGWNGNGWDLKLRDGSTLVFPESYYGKRPVDGALIWLRDPKGQIVKIERDKRRNLKRITSPQGRFIVFEHDPADRIIQAVDDEKRQVKYLYDAGGRLVQVEGPRFVTRYTYEHTYLMLIEENGQTLADFQYDEKARMGRISLADKRSYRFRYEYDTQNRDDVVRSFVTAPDGSVTKFDVASK
jgi:YD repeat-containing protein